LLLSAGGELADLSAHPTLLQVNARVSFDDLDAVPDAVLDGWVAQGFEWVYLLGVWQTGPAGAAISRSRGEWYPSLEAALPDLTESDICGSCFAVAEYRVADRLGGDEALTRLRARLHERGLRLLLDFVPNHTGPDHPWAVGSPSFYVRDGEGRPEHGRDPNFPAWTDTLQLDYTNPSLQEAMRDELLRIASMCDGVRCDMAMLLLPEVFDRTWGRRPAPFWPGVIATVKAAHPGFLFMAEVYWDLEWELQQQGFDSTYDKRLYDRLVAGDVRGVRAHLQAPLDFQRRLVRFLENHDEPRAATAFASFDRHRAAAVVTYLAPGMRFFHDGQREGRRIRLPVHLCRRAEEPVDQGLRTFYDALLGILRRPAVRDGTWQLLDVERAWDGNPSHESLLASCWDRDVLVVVNGSDHWSQGYVGLPEGWPPSFTLLDQLGPDRYERGGDRLYVDLPPWRAHVFAVSRPG
jgi:hypothetical protein